MPYYPSFPFKANRSGNELLRVLGALLSLTSMIVAAVSIFFHQSTLGLVISVVIALFGLRVFMLWLGARAPSVTLASTPPPVYPTSTFNPEQKAALHTRPLTSIGPNLSLSTRVGASSAPTVHGLHRSPASYMSHSPMTPITAYTSQPSHAARSSFAQANSGAMFEERHPQA